MTDKLTRPQAVELARRMWGDGESWTFTEIRDYLATRGHPVHATTVRTWVDDEYARNRNDERRESNRRHNREKRGSRAFLILDDDAKQRLGLHQGPKPSPLASEATPDVLLALRVEDKLTYPAIAAVARRFLGQDLSAEQVRYRLYELGVEKNPNKVRIALADNPMRRAA